MKKIRNFLRLVRDIVTGFAMLILVGLVAIVWAIAKIGGEDE